MNFHCDAVGPVKQGQKGPYFTVKCGEAWYNVEGDEAKRQAIAGKNFAGTVRPSKDKKYNSWMKVEAVEEPKPPIPETPLPTEQDHPTDAPKSDKPSWLEYQGILKAAHAVAKDLEPDGEGGEGILADRSRARVALVATVMIAFGQHVFQFQADDAAGREDDWEEDDSGVTNAPF